MNDVDVKDLALLTILVFTLFSAAVFWKLFLFKPPHKTAAEFEMQYKSHAVSNEATKLKKTAREFKPSDDTLRLLVEAMQRQRDRNGRKHHV